MPVQEVCKLLSPEVFIGWSVEAMDDVLPVDYLGVRPIFVTSTKTDTRSAWGLEGLATGRATTRLPLVAIGGIHSGNALQVLHAGVDSLAVVSVLCAADEPRAAASTLRSLCDEALKARESRNIKK